MTPTWFLHTIHDIYIISTSLAKAKHKPNVKSIYFLVGWPKENTNQTCHLHNFYIVGQRRAQLISSVWKIMLPAPTYASYVNRISSRWVWGRRSTGPSKDEYTNIETARPSKPQNFGDVRTWRRQVLTSPGTALDQEIGDWQGMERGDMGGNGMEIGREWIQKKYCMRFNKYISKNMLSYMMDKNALLICLVLVSHYWF